MNKILLLKDLRLMLKDLKFQIFFMILVILFLLSAISGAVTYKNLNEDYQTDLYRHQLRASDGLSFQLMQMLQSSPLNVVSKPSPAVLFSRYGNYPDKINVGIIFYTPTFHNYGTVSEDNFNLNWFFIIAILSSFIMLIMSFEAISSEKRSGTLRLLSIYGFKRQTILWHKYICYMLLYFIIIFPPALISMILFFTLSGTWSVIYMMKFVIVLLISLPFASFFVLLGIFISMLKNYRNAIVTIVFIWLLLVIIIPQSSNIIAEQVLPQKTAIEYQEMRENAHYTEWQIWDDEYDVHILDARRLREGIGVRAHQAADEKASLINQLELNENKKQVRLIRNISNISPFVQMENISEIIFDKGYYLLNFQQETAKRSINQIANLMIEQDSRDETSLHHFYKAANRDKRVLANVGGTPFSTQVFEHADLLFVTEIDTDDSLLKLVKILIRLLPILLSNLIIVIISVFYFEKLDIR